MYINRIDIYTKDNDLQYLANVNIQINDQLIIKNLRIERNNENLSLKMPVKKEKNGKKLFVVEILNDLIYNSIDRFSIDAFRVMKYENKKEGHFIYKNSYDQNLTVINQKIEDFEYSDNFELHELEGGIDLKITAVRIYRINDKKLKGLAELEFDSEIIIRGIKLLELDKIFRIFMPSVFTSKKKHSSIVFPTSHEFYSKIESAIMDEYGLSSEKPLSDIKSEIFRILWSNSENGTLLRSQVVPLLAQRQIDWKAELQASNLNELFEKLNFVTCRRLETKPGKFVDWVILSSLKEGNIKHVKEVDYKITEQTLSVLHRILQEKTRKSQGDMLVSEIVPYLRNNYPELAELLKDKKISVILQKCSFARPYIIQRDNGFIQNWVHISQIDENIGEKNFEIRREDEENGFKTNVEAGFDDILFQQDKEVQTSQELSYSENEKKTIRFNDDRDEIGRAKTASTNPFRYYPNSVLRTEAEVEKDKKIKDGVKEYRSKYIRDIKTSSILFDNACKKGVFGEHEMDVLTWISMLQYSQKTILLDLILGKQITPSFRFKLTANKVGDNLFRLYKYNLINIYRVCSLDDDRQIVEKTPQRIYTISAYGHTLLRDIGRASSYNRFSAFQDGNVVKQILSINQWGAKWMSLSEENDIHMLMNKIITVKLDSRNVAKINVIIEFNGQPFFAQSLRRNPEWGIAYLRKDNIEKIERIINVIQNFEDAYYDNRMASFNKKPILVLVCEDEEHCKEVFELLKCYLFKKNDESTISVWFTFDLQVYNDFYHAHFTYDFKANKIDVDLSQYGKLKPIGIEMDSDEDIID